MSRRGPTESDVFKDNKWCLDESVLRDFVLDELELKELEGRSLMLHSSYTDDVYYEVFIRHSRGEDRVGINLWYTVGNNKRYSCVYWRGRIVRWGVWVLELLHTLPRLINMSLTEMGEKEAKTSVREERGAMPNGSFHAAEFALAEDMGMDDSAAEAFRSWDRSGVPIRLI